MLETLLVVFILVHIALWVIGILTERPGFIMVAILLDFLTMSASVIAVEQTVVIPTSNSTATFAVKAVNDPYTAMAQFILLIWYVYTYFEMILDEQEEAESYRKRSIFVPLEWIKR